MILQTYSGQLSAVPVSTDSRQLTQLIEQAVASSPTVVKDVWVTHVNPLIAPSNGATGCCWNYGCLPPIRLSKANQATQYTSQITSPWSTPAIWTDWR